MSTCVNCVNRLGTCVGERNYRFFTYFLFGLSAYSLYVFITGVFCLVGYAQREAAETFGANWVGEFSAMVVKHFVVSGLTVFSGFVFLSVVSLAFYHCHLICIGETTNENVCRERSLYCFVVLCCFLFFSFCLFFLFFPHKFINHSLVLYNIIIFFYKLVTTNLYKTSK